MKNKLVKLLTMAMVVTLGTIAVGCQDSQDSTGGAANHPTYDNDSTPVVFACQELDGVFNPFYSSTAPDAEIIGMTQLSMFTTDKEGKIAYGADEAVAVLDYEQNYDEDADQTTYKFVLKNPSYNVKYSNGSYLTLKDVLFNMYEYLDPQYTGSSTMYSTKILGLKEYRTQESTEAGQENFEAKFIREAENRVGQLVTVMNEIASENSNLMPTSEELISTYLPQKETQYAGNAEFKYADQFVEDFIYIGETFMEELESDYTSNLDTYEDYDLQCDIQTFFYVEGLITIDLDKAKDDPERIDYAGFDYETIQNWNEDGTPMTKEQAIQIIYDSNYPDQFATIANYWATATTIRESFAADAKDKYFKENEDKLIYKDISGIKVITEDTVVNGTNYQYALYDSNGQKTQGADNGYEMFSITIDGVDPKAIWNFSFSIAPMYYYSNAEQIAKFNYGLSETEDPAFGVEYGSKSFQTDVIKDKNKIGVPMGAGAYKATTKDTKADEVSNGTFFESNVCYFERNEHFLMGLPKIKKIRYQVVPTNQMLSALTQGQVHYCMPNAKPEIVNELNGLVNDGFSYAQVETLGYGYIGINAKEVPSIYARRALISTMDTKLTLDYYSGAAEILYRPMSKVSWAYPKPDPKPYYEYDKTGQQAIALFRQAGYTQNSQGLMVDSSGKQFKLTFTIAGEDPDHPTAATFFNSQKILNAIGCDITVKTDVSALSKLNEGGLAVWAAAWSTTIDPDMYQTYHKDSTATSTLNWGYNAIKADTAGTTYGTEQAIIAELSDLIEKGREVLESEKRIPIYSQCLDLVMELAVELPTYQRDDLYAYNSAFFDTRTMTPANEVSPYNGPINKIWELSLITE